MKLNVLLWVAALLCAFLPRSADGRPAEEPATHRLVIPHPLLLRQGEEFSLRLGGGGSPASTPSSPATLSRALLHLTQRLLRARAQQQEDEGGDEGEEGEGDKGKRSEEALISLDLTFHLLREVLEMARAEQIAQQADSNRKMMDSFGK